MKYELTSESKTIDSVILYRIRALKDFDGVTRGDLGGWIESEKNLSQSGSCWISGNAKVYGNAKVSGNARISDYAKVSGNAWISDYAKVYGYAEVYGDAEVYG